MKRITAVLTTVALMLGLCACSKKKEAPTWQEQFDLGVRYLSEGDYEEAILTFTAAIEIDPMQAEAYEKLADAYLALGDLDSVLQTLRDGYAATGDARLQARIDELTAPEPTPTSTPVPTPEPTVEPTPEPTPESTPAPEPTPNLTPAPTPEPNSDFQIENGALVKYNGSDDHVVIPSNVSSIYPAVFWNKWHNWYPEGGTGSVMIHNGVTFIGAGAFGANSGLASINVESENQYYYSVDGVLFEKSQSALMQYPAGKPAASYAIPNGVKRIEYCAFSGCNYLASVNIPDSVTDISNFAFSNCTNLTSVTIPNGVYWIYEGTFDNCTSLTSITIPSSVHIIDNDAFIGCDSLADIYFSGTEEQWAEAIRIGGNKDVALKTATIHFNS